MSMPRRPKRIKKSVERSGNAGFTLLELIVSMVVLTYGVLGVAGSTIYVLRQVTVADLGTKRVAAVRSVVERVRAQPFDTVGSGTDSLGLYSLEWTSTRQGSGSKLIRVISTGPGLTTTEDGPRIVPAVGDTFTYLIVRP